MKSKRARDAESAIESEKPVDVPMADEPSSKKRKRDNDDGEVKDKSKKDKKDKKDKKKKHQGESRKEKKDKRKDLQDLPDQDEPEEEEAVAEVVKEDKASKKEKKKDKKNKESKDKEQSAPTVETNGDADEKKKEKKDKKKKDKKNKDQADESTTATATDAPNGTSNGTSNGEGEGIDLDESSSKKNDRHIVFVGNLPYSATAASISAHFASLSPIAVRCLTKKGENDPNVTCKGIAFVEFANVWTQRTCLDKFHHSMFDDKKSAARRINVELTAGGGGKNTNRHEKIAEKNRKLDENRAKRIDREKTTKAESAAVTHLDDAIHPSRRGRVPGSGY